MTLEVANRKTSTKAALYGAAVIREVLNDNDIIIAVEAEVDKHEYLPKE